LAVGEEKLYVKGVTYGTFVTDANGVELHDPERVRADFDAMAANGVNAVRTYTVPPRWLLDLAEESGLHVLVGLPWAQHVAFLDDPPLTREIERDVRSGVRSCAGHPAVLGYAVGNEIPAPIVRWHGRRPVERFIERLYTAAKEEDGDGLVTYVNFPSTEYLELPFLDFVAFNVYLEERDWLTAYLARLQNLAGDRPLVMAEIGLDSRRHGLEAQADSLGWQMQTAFAEGCAGAFAFAWTDEWHRGGFEIQDWDFGLVDRERQPKPSLAAVRAAFEEVPFPDAEDWPRFSVVVCSHNGAETIGATCEALSRLDHPNYEVIVVDDGSTDATAAIAAGYGHRVVSTENRGLSVARNTGLFEANGEIVAYVDDDAWPDPQWLRYLAHSFDTGEYASVGGPNVPPSDDPPVAACVARAPGGPIHVLTSDVEAEHIPGCNMAFRRDVLLEIGGFDEGFRVAGDDVDVCWRIQERGWKIGFNPGAMVKHRRRDSVRAYLRQQRGYGRAEALLARKWPQKYNTAGHATWRGRIYGDGMPTSLVHGNKRVRYGRWGTGLFQRLYTPQPTQLGSLPLMPEWILVVAAAGLLSALGLLWMPLLAAIPIFLFALTLTVFDAALSAHRAWLGRKVSLRMKALTALLFLAQPAARLWGRIHYGLHPWRPLPRDALAVPIAQEAEVWSESWGSVDDWVGGVKDELRRGGVGVVTGGEFDRWDLEVRSGLLGRARLRTAVEEHGGGRQLVRFRVMPRLSRVCLSLLVVFGVPTTAALASEAWMAAGLLGFAFASVVVRALLELSAATGALLGGIRSHHAGTADDLAAELSTRVPHAAHHDHVELAEPE
jgi:glycosyltransferase involved in cell wall biosynthesis